MNSYIYLTDNKNETGFSSIDDTDHIKSGPSSCNYIGLEYLNLDEKNLHLINKTPPTCSGNTSTLSLEMHFEKTKG